MNDDAEDGTAGPDDSDPSTADEIRWAAFDVLVADGFDAFTTQRVADEAGVSQSLVHYYYDTKEDLVYAMFADGLDNLADEIEARVDTDDPRERLLELARYMIRGEGNDEFDDAVAFSRLLLEIEAQAPYDERLREAVAYDVDFLQDYVVAAVEDGIDRGQFADVDSEGFAAMYVATLRATQNWRGVFADRDRIEPVLTGLEAVVDDYLVGGNS